MLQQQQLASQPWMTGLTSRRQQLGQRPARSAHRPYRSTSLRSKQQRHLSSRASSQQQPNSSQRNSSSQHSSQISSYSRRCSSSNNNSNRQHTPQLLLAPQVLSGQAMLLQPPWLLRQAQEKSAHNSSRGLQQLGHLQVAPILL